MFIRNSYAFNCRSRSCYDSMLLRKHNMYVGISYTGNRNWFFLFPLWNTPAPETIYDWFVVLVSVLRKSRKSSVLFSPKYTARNGWPATGERNLHCYKHSLPRFRRPRTMLWTTGQSIAMPACTRSYKIIDLLLYRSMYWILSLVSITLYSIQSYVNIL